MTAVPAVTAVPPRSFRPRAEHRQETVRFWRENRADAALRERFVVPAEEYERFAAALRKAVGAHEECEEENIRQVRDAEPLQTALRPPLVKGPPLSAALSPQMAARIREAERRQRDTVRAALEVGAAELSRIQRCCAERRGLDGKGGGGGLAGIAEYQKSRCFFLNRTQPPTETERCVGPAGCSSAVGSAR